jgi:hypothetical protein
VSRVEFTVESLANSWDDFLFLAHCHWAETDMARAGDVLKLDRERYLRYGDAYLLIMARKDGDAVGQCGLYLTPSMHTQQLIVTEDALYILPEHRRGRIVLDMHKFAVTEVKRRGATKIFMTAAPYNGVCRILEYMGYKLSCYHYELDLTMQASPGADSTVTASTVTENSDVRTQPACPA